jgi:hypothetical protein
MDSAAKYQDLSAKDWGLDESLLESNLQLTPQERIEQHQAALDLAFSLEEAGKVYREKSQSSFKAIR